MKKHLFILSIIVSANINSWSQHHIIDSLESVNYELKPAINNVLYYKNKQTILLDSSTIANSAATTIDQALRMSPGVDIRQRGPAGVQMDIGIDGGGFDQSILLINGIKIPDAQTGHNMLVLPIELNAVDQIQIIKGGASSLYGVNALTGAINVITTAPKQNSLSINLAGGSSFKQNDEGKLYSNARINIDGGFVTGKFNHHINTGWKKGNGYRKNTAYTSPNFWYETQGTIGKNELHLMTGYRYSDFGAHSFYAAPGDSNSHETVQNSLVALKHLLPINKHFSWTSNVVYNYKTDDYKYIKEPVVGRNIHYQNIFNFNTNLIYKSKIGNIKAGVEYREEYLNSTNLGVNNRNNIGLILNYDKLFASKYQLEAGIYANENSKYGFQLYPNIGLGYWINVHSKILANYSQAQRLPTFTDLYYKQKGVIEGNPLLNPESSKQAEIGYVYQVKNFKTNAYVFYRSIDNMIDWTKQNLTDVWSPTNYHRVNTLGFHISGDKIFEINDKHILGIRLGYNYLEPSVIVTKENQISRYAINALRHQMISNIYLIINNNLKLQAGANYYSRISYKSYWMCNASINYSVNNLSFNINIQNINNATIKEAGAQPLPGSWYEFAIRYTIK